MAAPRRCDGPHGYPFDDDPPHPREQPAGVFDNATFAATPAAARIRREAWRPSGRYTPSKQKKLRRDLVILLCHEVGLSERTIADVFGIVRSQVASVVRDTKAKLEAAREDAE